MAESTETLLAILLAGRPLNRDQSRSLFEEIVTGQLPETIIAAAIVAMKIRGETVAELVGAAQALLAAATPFPDSPFDSVDIVGTGGDGLNTLNISTLAAITANQQPIPLSPQPLAQSGPAYSPKVTLG